MYIVVYVTLAITLGIVSANITSAYIIFHIILLQLCKQNFCYNIISMTLLFLFILLKILLNNSFSTELPFPQLQSWFYQKPKPRPASSHFTPHQCSQHENLFDLPIHAAVVLRMQLYFYMISKMPVRLQKRRNFLRMSSDVYTWIDSIHSDTSAAGSKLLFTTPVPVLISNQRPLKIGNT